MEHLLEIEELTVRFDLENGQVRPVNGVSFAIKPSETICIVGESGSGKSVTSLSILQLLGKNGRIEEGQIRFLGDSLRHKSEPELRRIRGGDIAMIFQEPMTALNPVFTIGHQLVETIRIHSDRRGKSAKAYAIDMLRKVGIARPEAVMKEYPHSLSGGMRQRIVIAIALACNPRLLIADEPTTALDVTIQAQILSLMKQLREDNGTAILFITHDLSVVAEMADRVVVMYAGQVVEDADVYDLFEKPLHPYTQGLMRSMPAVISGTEGRLEGIPGSVPSLRQLPKGCRFHTRCPFVMEICQRESPELVEAGHDHKVRCWLTQGDVAQNAGR